MPTYFGTDGDDSIDALSLNIAAFEEIFLLGGDDFASVISNVVTGGAGNDTVQASTTRATINYRNSPAGIDANLQTGVIHDGWGGIDQVLNVDWIYGSAFSDNITGNSGLNNIQAHVGNDTVDGGANIDIAYIGREIEDVTVFGDLYFSRVYVQNDFVDFVMEFRNVETLNADNGAIDLLPSDSIFLPSTVVARSNTSHVRDPHRTKPGDFNGDGNLDLILIFSATVPERLQNPGYIFVGDGNGGFVDATSSIIPEGFATENPRVSIVADFNNDGRDDYFAGDTGTEGLPIEIIQGGQNLLLLSEGSSGMRDATATNLPQKFDYTHGAAAGDIDLDGDIDLVGQWTPATSDTRHYAVGVLLNDGTGVFTPSEGHLPFSLENPFWAEGPQYGGHWFGVFDLNNDDAPDIFVGGGGGENFILHNDGTGLFPELIPLPMADPDIGSQTVTTHYVEAWDFSGDGLPDLVVLEGIEGGFQASSINGYYLQFLRQNPDGSFVDETAIRYEQEEVYDGFPAQRFDLVDLDLDGDLDIVIDWQHILVNDGDNTFQLSDEAYKFGNGGIADFNGDGYPDMAKFLRLSTNDRDDFAITVNFNRGGSTDGVFSWAGVDAAEQGVAGPSNDMMDAGGGNDSLWGLAGDDLMLGGAGDDNMFGNFGDDTIAGGDDNDLIKAHPGADMVTGDNGNDMAFGGANDDQIDGGPGSDTLNGNSGFDTIIGGEGDDTLRGQGGRDSLVGGEGDDFLVGMQGFDTLDGGPGNDTLIGGPANDTLTGGDGEDLFVFAAGQGENLITDFFDGVDRLLLQGIGGFDDLNITKIAGGTKITVVSGSDALSISMLNTFIAPADLTDEDIAFG